MKRVYYQHYFNYFDFVLFVDTLNDLDEDDNSIGQGALCLKIKSVL